MQSGDDFSGDAFAISADRVFDGQRWHDRAAVLIQNGTIVGIAAHHNVPAEWRRRQLPPNTFLAPGFIDLQVNGGGGVLLNDDPSPEAMRKIARAHRRFGTTSCLPTLISDSRAKAKEAIAAAKVAAGTDGILGLHLEGPFLSPARPGIHRPDRIVSARDEDLEWLSEASQAGHSLVTLAPECVPEGFVGALTKNGIRVSVGHSEATAEALIQAIGEGLSGVTHLFNAMPPMSARAPGIIGVVLADSRLTAGIIVDGMHVDPIAISVAFAAKGSHGVMLVTDAMPTVGTAADCFKLMGREISLKDGRLVSESGTLAGAHLDMCSAVRNAVKLVGISVEDALRSASLTPARYLGIDHQRGQLSAGARADLVALTSELEVVATWIGGSESIERNFA